MLYEASSPAQPQLLKARCGAKIGIAAQAMPSQRLRLKKRAFIF